MHNKNLLAEYQVFINESLIIYCLRIWVGILAPLSLALGPWGSYLTFLIFSFLVHKMRLVTYMFLLSTQKDEIICMKTLCKF